MLRRRPESLKHLKLVISPSTHPNTRSKRNTSLGHDPPAQHIQVSLSERPHLCDSSSNLTGRGALAPDQYHSRPSRYRPEPRPQYYTQRPPRAYHAPARPVSGVLIEIGRPRSPSPSPTRIVVIDKGGGGRRDSPERPVGFLSWLCGGCCCFWICCQCVDDCWGCCPAKGYDSD
ncbi:hypothetical protein N658DRAFT_216624 [Parathielavia hyrcaniae]|uniref:Uncharacterized protein n=1 Tax=Parathielavia hyrcaniae TaxID=113614 RepID=A0AAN6PV75_9PEZI|nr:hypothetical protein N658DRAFT_216624 [Parathielavia hyrcaniae]